MKSCEPKFYKETTRDPIEYKGVILLVQGLLRLSYFLIMNPYTWKDGLYIESGPTEIPKFFPPWTTTRPIIVLNGNRRK